ncbi:MULTISPECIES: hypothetical protein [Deinococcus]|uniref:Uncharacterized protein n=1 Tax=Deinococcus geothermalis (strain DSM 11300 / CIP 105573 / AG-3a) TaxID=319795 RepID=Q1J002_DEIGD|nr:MULTISPECIES: hypothetical protein [Deinococcus]ABF45182.1 hypothetical protein Dgeo_0880 [Deinococcus geothermalis DSM 11300]MBI0444464.1 hypothetical protein [Deinococcus sp. DB0503]
MTEAIVWLDLRVEDDPHPRRFDSPETLRAYLTRIERLTPDAVTRLLEQGEIGPPAARRVYRLQPLQP